MRAVRGVAAAAGATEALFLVVEVVVEVDF